MIDPLICSFIFSVSELVLLLSFNSLLDLLDVIFGFSTSKRGYYFYNLHVYYFYFFSLFFSLINCVIFLKFSLYVKFQLAI